MTTTTLRTPAYPSLKQTVLPWTICGIGMLFYFYNLFLRVSPSVMHEELMSGLHIGAYQFGNLAAFYYYAYTPMQIPAGVLYDRFGVRLVQFLDWSSLLSCQSG
jgi:MFS family permease